jgi:hypothetical protein
MTLFITPDDDANDDDDDATSMQDEQKKAREVSVATYVTVLEMANVTPQVKVGLLKVLIEQETDDSVKAVVAPALQGDLDVTALKEKLKAGWTAQMYRVHSLREILSLCRIGSREKRKEKKREDNVLFFKLSF